jgi:hypothetical protein
MNPEVRSMLEKMYACIHKREPDPKKAWDRLLEFVAADNSALLMREFEGGLEWLFSEPGIAAELLQLYDAALLRSECRDDLGSFYNERFSDQSNVAHWAMERRQGNRLEPYVDSLEPEHPDSILITEVGSGAILLKTHKKVPDAKLFGVATDLGLYRIALSNCAMHNVPALILHADPCLHELDLGDPNGKFNWQYANRWKSPKNMLRPKTNRTTIASTS